MEKKKTIEELWIQYNNSITREQRYIINRDPMAHRSYMVMWEGFVLCARLNGWVIE